MPGAGQSLETDFFARNGIVVKRTRIKNGTRARLQAPNGKPLYIRVEGPHFNTDDRLLGELLFYSHCPSDAAKIRKDDEITDGRALPVLAFSTAKLGKQVRAFISAVDLCPC